MSCLALFRRGAALLFAASLLLAQERLEIVGPEPSTLRLGDTAQVELQVVDPEGQPRELQVPQIDGLQIRVNGPMRQMQQSIVGGRRTQKISLTWRLELQPTREGTFVVPPFKVWTGTKEQLTRELRIEAKKDLQAAELGWLEVHVEPQRVYVHEPIRVRLEFGVLQGLRLVQDVHREPNRDHPYFDVEVTAPWLTEFPGGEPIPQGALAGDVKNVICNRRLMLAAFDPEHERGGKRWQYFRVDLAFLPTQAGKIELTAPSLRYHLIRRAGSNDPFLVGSRALTANYVVDGQSAAVEVLPIPEAGRPQPYYGAVGRFTIEASLDRDSVKVGTAVRLSLTVRGQGNLEFLRLPPLDELPGFHKLGQTELKRDADKVVVTYDLTPLSTDVREVPAIGWNYFDTQPGSERFVAVSTRALPLAVQALPPGEGLLPLPDRERKAVTPGVDDVFDLPSLEGPAVLASVVSPWLVWAAVLGPWLLAWLAWIGRQRLLRARADVVGSRSRGAAKVMERALQAGAEPLDAFAEYLGSRLGVPGAAVIRADVAEQLQTAGLDAASAVDVAVAIEQGTAARYGGGSTLQPGAVRELVQRLERLRFGVGAMLLWLLVPWCACALSPAAAAQQPATDPIAAYRAGDYAAADAAFAQRHAATGDRRCMQARGNCQVRMGDLPRALWAYECARLGLPRDPELLANLQFVTRRLELDEGPRGLLDELAALRARCTRGEQVVVCALLMAVAAGCLLFGRRRALRQLGVVALVVASAFAIELSWLAPARLPGAIALQSLEITAEPKAGLSPVATVRPGVRVELLGGTEGGFVRVRAADRSGFVPREHIAVIE